VIDDDDDDEVQGAYEVQQLPGGGTFRAWVSAINQDDQMTKHKVSELTGDLLDAAVAKALGHRNLKLVNGEWRSLTEDGEMSPIAAFSEDWSAGGPIIQANFIEVRNEDKFKPNWVAYIRVMVAWTGPGCPHHLGNGPTPLIAAMRAFVASKLGEEVEL